MKSSVLGDAELHFWLTRSVARVMGVNLSEALAHGRLDAHGYAALVTACRQCENVERCTAWLAMQRTCTRTAPPDCVNAPVLQPLARPH